MEDQDQFPSSCVLLPVCLSAAVVCACQWQRHCPCLAAGASAPHGAWKMILPARALRRASLLVCLLFVTLWCSSFALLLPVRAAVESGVCQSGSIPEGIGTDCAPGFFCQQ
jgi:hypothetical protein